MAWRKKLKMLGHYPAISQKSLLQNCYSGVANSSESQRQKNRKNAQEFLNSFSGRTLLVGDCFYEYARQKSNLRKIGRSVGEFDLLIGSTAIVNDLILVTRNTKDFINLGAIKLENWIDT